MQAIKTSIIPHHPIITPKETAGVLHLEAICVFAALGFFLENDAWYTNQTALQPASDYVLDENGKIISENTWWQWHYSPRDISLKQATEEFAHIFEHIIKEQTQGKQVILPLSGGLDSRTQAAALKSLGTNVNSYGYRFAGGHDETRYGKEIAQACNFHFQAWEVPHGYLWNQIDRLAALNGCYSEFTHPRQMAFLDRYAAMGDVFSLGHWGDVLFDDMGVPDDLPFEQQVAIVIKKILKKGGQEVAEALWKGWGLQGAFMDYLQARVETLLAAIDIPDSANARIRAFKSLYWAPRWTSVNVSVFEAARPIGLPYYDDRMCEFICTIPEKHLAGRQIQIEYLKMRAPQLARIPWQDHRPFNLYNYHWNKAPWNLPFRLTDKAQRVLSQTIGRKFIQRNWELQFLGEHNDVQLRSHLLESDTFKRLIPKELVHQFYTKFKESDQVKYAHPLSMLLTLSVFSNKEKLAVV
jgi:rhodanese-related sulfurtransferase